MKDRRYANRGENLEELIRFANERYLAKGIAVIDKLPTEFKPIRDRNGKICSTKVEHKSKVDFIGRYLQYPIAIEAKNSNEKSIRWDRVEEHQADYMDAFTAQPGTIGMVIVSFSYNRFFAIPWKAWQTAYNARVRPGASRTAQARFSGFGIDWDIPKKNSVNINEIPPQWEIPSHDNTFGIHYLKYAPQFITPENSRATVK